MRKLRLDGFCYKKQSKDSALLNCKGLAHDHLISYYLIFISQLSKLSFDLRLLHCLFSLASNHGIISNACAFSHYSTVAKSERVFKCICSPSLNMSPLPPTLSLSVQARLFQLPHSPTPQLTPNLQSISDGQAGFFY